MNVADILGAILIIIGGLLCILPFAPFQMIDKGVVQMIDVLWNVVGYIGLVVLALAIIGTGILLLCGIISIVKQVKEEFKK